MYSPPIPIAFLSTTLGSFTVQIAKLMHLCRLMLLKSIQAIPAGLQNKTNGSFDLLHGRSCRTRMQLPNDHDMAACGWDPSEPGFVFLVRLFM